MGRGRSQDFVPFRGVRLRGLVVASLALAAACSAGSDTPQALPSLTAGPSPTATPVPVPTEAQAHTPQGAAAFVRFYYDRLNAAWSKPDPAELAGLSDKSCGTCANYVHAAESFALQRRRVSGPSVKILSAEAPPEEQGLVAVDVFFDEPARDIVTMDGSLVQSFPASRQLHWTVYVMRQPVGWVVRAAVKRP